jgi:hypothetical protein
MRRRSLLAAAGATVLAGCSNRTGSADGATPTGTVTDAGSPSFELRGASFPDAITLNVPTTFAIAVRNTGTAAGTFATRLESKVGDGPWETGGELTMPLDPGETGKWRSPRFAAQYLHTLHFRLAAFDEEWSIETTPRQLDFGHYYDVPTGLRINVLGGSFETTYPTATNATVTPTTAPAGRTWAVMRVDVRNRLDQARSTPAATEFVLEVDGERRSLDQSVTDDPYRDGELGDRAARRGDLVYAVPEGTRARELKLWWEASLPNGEIEAIWTK